MVTSQILKSNTLYLKSLTADDVTTTYFSWLQDLIVSQFIKNKDQILTLQTLRTYVKKLESSPADYLFGIYLLPDSTHIGNIKIGNIHPIHLYADIGLMIGDKGEWGKGYGSQAIRLVTRYAFSKLKLHKLFATINEQNSGSYKAFLKAGYKLTGRFKDHVRFNNRFIDVLIVECYRESFKE